MTAVVNILGNGILFSSNETLRRVYDSNLNQCKPNILMDAVSGGLAGAIFRLAIHPADLVRSQLMADEASGKSSDIAKRVWHSSGIVGFYRGASVAVLRAICVNAFAFPAFHWATRCLTLS